MARLLGLVAVLVVAFVVLSRCGEAQVTPDWVPNGAYAEDVVIGDDSISIPIYSGVGGQPPLVGPQDQLTTPEPSSWFLAAASALGFRALTARRRRRA